MSLEAFFFPDPSFILQSEMAQNMTNHDNVTDISPTFDHAFLGMVIFIGIPGNLLTITILLSTRRLRRSPTTVYLAFLAGCDSLFLTSMGIMWASSTLLNHQHTTDILCKVVTYLTNVTGCTSTWLVVAFTIERYFVVVHPLHRLAQCSVQHARRNVLLILPWPLLIYSCSFVIVGTQGGMCAVLEKYRLHAMLFHAVDIFIILIVPFVIIVSANIRIAAAMLHSRKNMSRQPTALSSVESPSVPMLPRRDSKASNFISKINTTLALKKRVQDMRTTKMLVLISIVFVCLNFPHNIYRIRELIARQRGEEPPRVERTISAIFMAMYYVNFAVNFVLYSFASTNFRCAAKQCFRCTPGTHSEATGAENVSAALLSAQLAENMVTVVKSNMRNQEHSTIATQNSPVMDSV